MKTPANAKEKIAFLKEVLSGKASIKDALPPVVRVLHTYAIDANYSGKENTDYTEEQIRKMEKDTAPQKTLWIIQGIDETEIHLPHNYRGPLPVNAKHQVKYNGTK